MNGMHPQFILSKRFPVHTAIEQMNIPELLKQLKPEDARFHFGRKLTNCEVSVLHQACAARPTVWSRRGRSFGAAFAWMIPPLRGCTSGVSTSRST